MNVKLYLNVFVVTFCLLIVTLSGCAPEENDLVPPDVTFDGGVETPTASTTATITGSMDPGSTIEVDLTTSATVNGLVQDPVAGTWEFTVDNLIEGANLILVSVSDTVGNTRTIQMTIVVDLTAPVTTIMQYPVTAQPGNFTFAGTVDESDSSVAVDVYDSSAGLVSSGAATVDANIWHADLDLSLQPDGLYTVVATGTDRLGNQQQLTDTTPPAEQGITLDSGSPSFAVTTPVLPVILATTVDSQLFVGTTDIDNVLTVTPSTSIIQPVGVVDWSATVSLIGAGTNVVTFHVSDGVLATEQKVLIVRDQTAPTVVHWSSPVLDEISILFNESMAFDPDPLLSTIGVENLTVVDSTGTVVPVNSVTASADLKTITFVTDLLVSGDTYTATLQTTTTYLVEDGRGNSLATSYSWTFKK
jgi:hypothetical protein